ncbi:MAG: DNA mismatch repair protein MutS [Deltaproteobacteria bacterium]|nr:DNA mismatch repair protein MutS [Deltaproteobacteria bacterium]
MTKSSESPTEEPYQVPIEESFDLHPYRPADVLRMLDAYLDAAQGLHFHEVRLIHGRGKGVQRAQVQGFLEKDPRVIRWVQAPPHRGGWGATLAFLHVMDAQDEC